MINKTLCEHCVFKVCQDDTQIGCSLNRLGKLPHKFNKETKHYEINTYCSTCRNIYWKNSKMNQSNESLIADVYNEVKLSYDIVSVLETQRDAEQLIFNIHNKNYKPSNVHLVFSVSNENEARNIVGLIRDNISLSITDDIKLNVSEYIAQSKSGYILFTESDYNEKIIEQFNDNLNIHIKPSLFYEDNSMCLFARFLWLKFMHTDHPVSEIQDFIKSVKS